MLELVAHYAPSSRIPPPFLLAIGLAGILLSLYLGITPTDTQ